MEIKSKTTVLFDWLTQNKKMCLALILLLILLRFGYLNYYNWHYGNSGQPGVQYYVDSYRYLDGAQNLLQNQPLGHKQAEYIGYIGLLAFAKWAGGSMGAVVVFQVLMALLSAWFLYSMARKITGSKFAGMAAIGLYLANPFITVWHLYVLTESLYTSFVIISVWSIVKACEKRVFKFYILCFIVILTTATIRPNGWILMPIMFSAFILNSSLRPYMKYAAISLVAITFLIGVACIPASNQIIQKVEGSVTMNDLLMRGEVVWGHPELRLSMPEDTAVKKQNWTSSSGYIIGHPFACTKLALCRVSSELLEVNRPWYSLRYRILLFIWLWLAYILAIIGWINYRKETNVKVALWIVLGHILIIALTYAEHEHRFLNYFLPLIYLLSACGVTKLIKMFILPVKLERSSKAFR